MAWKAVKTVLSSSTYGKKYYIKQETGTKNYSCTCESWVFNNESPKTCKHIKAILAELKKYNPELAKRERWLIFNKIDLLPPEEQIAVCDGVVKVVQ